MSKGRKVRFAEQVEEFGPNYSPSPKKPPVSFAPNVVYPFGRSSSSDSVSTVVYGPQNSSESPAITTDPRTANSRILATVSGIAATKNEKEPFHHCNECEIQGKVDIHGLTNCFHPEDLEEFDLSLNPGPVNSLVICGIIFLADIGTHVDFKMLNPRNLCALLTENVDNHASTYMYAPFTPLPLSVHHTLRLNPQLTSTLSVLTIYGNLVGYSDGIRIANARRMAAEVGVTWRHKEASMTRTHLDPTGLTLLPIKSVSVTVAKRRNVLMGASMEFSSGDLIAVHYIKEKLLVGVLMDVKDTNDEERDKSKVKDGAGTIGSKGDGSQASDDRSVQSGQSNESLPISEQECNGEQEDAEEGGAVQKPEPSDLQILRWKAEGMAEALRSDLHDFKMPGRTYR
ncbi:hypothetical protein MMC12_007364 [Toensbergia leucococca]|nr:hypothetical protein [Toensbergia leucococca]